MVAPALNSRLCSHILFLTKGPFSKFAEAMNGACAERDSDKKTTHVAVAVIAFFQSAKEPLYALQPVKTWVLGICKTSRIHLKEKKGLTQSEIIEWTLQALGSETIDRKMSRTFNTAFKMSLEKQIDTFDEGVQRALGENSFADFEWIEESGGDLDELVAPSTPVEEDEILLVERPILALEGWTKLVAVLKERPALLLGQFEPPTKK